MMDIRRALGPFSIAVVLAASSCRKDTFGFICTENIVPGIEVVITSAHTGAPIADSAVAFAIDGGYSDSLRACVISSFGQLLSRCGADERPGTYSAVVTRPGYRRWSIGNLQVRSDVCHVRTVTVQAALQPAP